MSLQKGVAVYTPNTIDEQMVATLGVAKCSLVRLEISSLDNRGTVNYLCQHGFQVIALIPLTIVPGATKDDWQAPMGSDRFTRYVTNYAHECRVLAQAMPGVAVWELCNEEGSIGSAYRLSVQQYALLYFQAHIALRAATPKAQVIVGGLFAWAPHQFGGDTYANSGAEFDRQLAWIEEIQTHPLVLDGCGVHLYVWPGGALDPTIVHDYMADYAKVTDRPLWITEYGWQSGIVGDAVQAANITAMHEALSQHPQVTAACYFCLYDFTGTSWGLSVPDALQRKSSFTAFQELP